VKTNYKLAVGVAAISIVAFANNTDRPLYLVQSLLTLLLMLIADGRASGFMLMLSILFVLGNWLKVSLHYIFDYPYVEPTGSFGGTNHEWSDFHIYSAAITAALMLNTAMIRAVSKANSINCNYKKTGKKPRWHYSASILFILLIYYANWNFGFYRIGVARELHLPFGLNALASFLVFLGLPMLLAIQASYDVERHKTLTTRNVLLIATISIVAATTTYSRAIVMLVMMPILYGAYCQAKRNYDERLSIKPLMLFSAIALLISILVVSGVRISVYSDESALDTALLYYYLFESLGLVSDRWIGAESLMVAVASKKSLGLFIELLIENPAAGVNSIYQALSNSRYVELDGKTFLTLPGVFALLAFSGNFFIIFIGVTMISGIGIAIEKIMNNYFQGFVALRFIVITALAYHFSQMNYPYLLIPFLVQLLIFIKLAAAYVSSEIVMKRN